LKNRLAKILRSFSGREQGKAVNKQSILTNITWLVAGNVVIKPLWFVLILLTARLLGAAGFGQFMLAISFVSVASVILEGGVDTLTVRELSNNPDRYGVFLAHSLSVKAFSGVLSIIVAVTSALVLKMNLEIVTLVFLASFYSLANAFLLHFRAVFRAFEVLKYEAISIVLEKGAVLILCGGILLARLGVTAYMLGYVIAYCIASLTTFVILLNKIGIPRFKFTREYFWQEVLRPALPFAVLNLFTIIYFRSGTLMLEAITGREELVGYYNAGYKLVESFMLVPTIIVAPIYPVISRSKADRESVMHVIAEASRILLFISISISSTIFIFQDKITLLFFGKGYLPATSSVGLLALTMIPISINFAAGSLIAAVDRQKLSNVFVLIVTMLNIGVNYLLIRSFGVLGAATTTVLTETLLVLFNLYIVRDYIALGSLLRVFLKAILPPVAAEVVVLEFLPDVRFAIQASVVFGILVVGFFGLRLITLNDIRKVLRLAP
jgi:O-antigen/teichoic acid export membrane protein